MPKTKNFIIMSFLPLVNIGKCSQNLNPKG